MTAKIGSLKLWGVALATLSLLGIGCAGAVEPTATPRPAATPAPTYTPIPTFTPLPGAPSPTRAPVATPTVAPAPTPTAPPTLARPTEWTVIMTEPTAQGDPYTEYTSTSASNIMRHVYDTLIWLGDPAGGTNIQPQPRLAESWEFPDDVTFVVHLRKGVKFHNGEELTAEHVKYATDAVNASNPPLTLKNSLPSVGKVSVVDKYTIRWDMPETYALALTTVNSLQFAPFVRKEISGAEFGKKPIGVGPYRSVQWEHDKPVILEAYEGYWRGKAAFPPRLTFRYIGEPATRTALILVGQAQIAESVPLGDINRLKSNPKADVAVVKNFGRLVYHFNLFLPHWKQKNVRLAVNYAVDKELIAEAILEGHGSPQPAGLLLPGNLGYTPDMKPYPYDPAKAKELLAQAGLSQGFTFKWLVTQGVFQKGFEIAEASVNQMAKAGIKANLDIAERARLRKDRVAGDYDLLELTWPWSWDLTSTFRTVIGANGLNHNDKVMIPKYGPPPEVLVNARKLHDQALSILDTAKRAAILERLNKFSAEEALFLNIHTYDEIWGIAKATRWRPRAQSTTVVYYDLDELFGLTTPK